MCRFSIIWNKASSSESILDIIHGKCLLLSFWIDLKKVKFVHMIEALLHPILNQIPIVREQPKLAQLIGHCVTKHL